MQTKPKFARLFETKEHGQILLKLGENSHGPTIEAYFMADAFNIAGASLSYGASGAGVFKAMNDLEKATEKDAIKLVELVKQKAKPILKGAACDTIH
ncbi:hypothetical protein [Maridesulfovibrio sp.]|uniref:hypothetical protein n=1 Tax=Maridesulfovibrio sp. TaxID=2795000 RepID=UPI0029CA2A17|nr:hypothetical protein [Maridesulfovibrio sp.]